ncbi:hypothetical protein scyTo_0009903 [Scyliorhinus torazame]|uniref:Nucleosome assembly protein 1-like 1 n=1 Tax=Scyliorhinus torazame TaxID=75743 RepID=A0A401NVS1_SCYTO|nr:hypothetical protein [Scyliorhinus torazame]
MEDVEDIEEDEASEDADNKARQLTVQMMQNPRILAALQERLDGLRSDIINAIFEPTEDECKWQGDDEEELSDEVKEKVQVEEEKKDEEKEEPKGIPEFWLTVFKNVDLLSDMIQHDEPILKHLKDLKVKFSDPGQPMSFTLEFKFEPNEYFTNDAVTKTYKMRSQPDESDPFSFDGPEIMDAQENGELDVDSEAIIATDFEIGNFLHERIIPRAVLYFTGEAVEDDDDDYDEEGEVVDDGEEEEEADEGNDPDYDPKKDPNPPSECKQP